MQGKIKDLKINPEQIVRVTEMGNVIEITYFSKQNKKQTIRLLENGMYLELSTGEIRECKKSEKRVDRINALKVSFRKLRNIINANVINPCYCQWITLTYVENMRDNKRLYIDFENFIKRYRYFVKKDYKTSFEYIAVPEPQAKGGKFRSWHFHVITIFEKKPPFVPNEILRKLWGFGFVSIKSLSKVDNVGAYLSAYLTNIPVTDGANISEEDLENIEKKYIKGGRLVYYPAGMNLYRCSRGIKKPKITEMTYREAKNLVHGTVETYRKTVKIVDESTDFEMIAHTECYNKIRGR